MILLSNHSNNINPFGKTQHCQLLVSILEDRVHYFLNE